VTRPIAEGEAVMISRRRLFSSALAFGGLSTAAQLSACPQAFPLHKTRHSDMNRLHQRLQSFRTHFNNGNIEAFLANEPQILNFRLFDDDPRDLKSRVALLQKFRRGYGQMISAISNESTLFWPEYPQVYFITSMETMPEEESLGYGLGCGGVGGHSNVLVSLAFHERDVDRRNQLNVLEIGLGL